MASYDLGSARPKRVRTIDPAGVEEPAEENLWAYLRFDDAEEQARGVGGRAHACVRSPAWRG